jgi:nuclear receptor subfamily 1 group I
MSKKISAFKNLCIEDQIALLKGGCTEMMILRSVMQYHNGIWRVSFNLIHFGKKIFLKKNYLRFLQIPHSQEDSHMANIKADVLKLAKGNVYTEHDRFIQNFPESLRSDENVILIMCAITLFSPNRPRTIHKDVIRLEQNSYYYLLRRYLESVYDGCQARSIFLQLINNIKDLNRLNDEVINVYLNVNPCQVEPLLREIFDLKMQ